MGKRWEERRGTTVEMKGVNPHINEQCRERERTACDLHDYGNAIPSLEKDESTANDGMNASVTEQMLTRAEVLLVHS